jgi:signal transduction histidine kinase/ligand-binding sensor domain-containing protein/DNA-binding response OmpR family regulator
MMDAADFKFQHLNTSYGLPNQQVESMVQDNNGYIWIGTRNGLAKYDGYNVETYYHVEGDANSLVHNFVHGLFVDSKHRLWVSTENGVSLYRQETDDFRNYHNVRGFCTSFTETNDGRILTGSNQLYAYDAKIDSFVVIPSLNAGTIASLSKDKAGNIYVSASEMIFSMDASLTRILPLDVSINGGHNAILPLLVDSHQRLWIGTNDGGVICYHLRTRAQQRYSASQLTGGIVRVIVEDKEHRIWFGTENGVLTLNPDGSSILTQKGYSSDGLSDNAIYTILSDRQNNIWIGSYFGGVDYLSSQKPLFRHFEPSAAKGELKARIPRMMTETSPGVFWIASEDQGVNIYNSVTGQFTPFNGIPNLDSNTHSIYYDSKTSDIWIGTRFKGLFKYNLQSHKTTQYYHTKGLTSEGIFYITRDKKGRLWVATMEGLRYYDDKTDTFCALGHDLLDRTFIYSLFVDRHNQLWASTVACGVYCIGNNKITSYSRDNGCGLTDNYVISTFEDSKGRLWIGTNNNGLFWLDAKSGKVHQAGTWIPRQCTVCSIIEDKTGCLWIGTDQGLFCHRLSDGHTRCFSAGAELPVNQFNFTSTYLASNGQVLMGTFDGLITFRPQQMHAEAKNMYVHFKKLFVNDLVKQQIDYTDRITLTYDESHSFHIEYGVVMPENVQGIQYQIKVDGIDSDWRSVGTERRFYGYLLSPGTYQLHVRANTCDSDWDQCPERTLTIVIKAPFYLSPLAYIIYFICFAALVVGGLSLYNMRMKEQEKVRYANMERAKVEEIDRMKSNFFTMVSHELKTPLSLIMAPLKSIGASQVDKEVGESLNMAIRNCSKMERLINELVTFNKIESDNFPFYVQQGNPVEFVSVVADNFNEAVQAKDLQLNVNCMDNGEDGWFSPSYIEHILNNLMSNAIKFTGNGGTITINAEITQEPDSPDLFLKMQVSDTGIGIIKEEQKNIFDRYYQTKRGYSTNSSGWGIGLALVHRLVEIHKGSVSVESELGKGSTFTVMLNISGSAFSDKNKISADSEQASVANYLKKLDTTQMVITGSAASTATTPSALAPHKRTLLVVEDNEDMLHFLKQLFAADYNVLTAPDGQQAWDIAISRTDIDIVVSDVMMPVMTGAELCNMIKSNMSTSHIPVILLTAKGDPEDVKDGYRNGADAYVLKPFDPESLSLQISNLLKLIQNRQKSIFDGSEQSLESNDSLTQLDRDFIQRLMELVDKNIGNANFSVTDITLELGMSRSLLHTKMKSLMNTSAGDYIRHKRIQKACEMITQGHNVSETAYSCGFADPNYFSKVFKKMVGVAPSDYHK